MFSEGLYSRIFPHDTKFCLFLILFLFQSSHFNAEASPSLKPVRDKSVDSTKIKVVHKIIFFRMTFADV